MNSVAIIGRLTADPELRKTGSGISVCSFTLAVKRPHTKDETDFLNCTAWRQSAEYLCKYGHKGGRVAVTGIITQRTYLDKEENKRYVYEIICDALELLSNRSGAQESNFTSYSENEAEGSTGGFSGMEESNGELPF